MNKVKFIGTIKPSITDRVVVVRCFSKILTGDSKQQPVSTQIYWLPSYCTNFTFSVLETYKDTHTVQVYGVNDRVVQAEIKAE